ncbi:ralBP1-associated Eps domain-containing protein 2 isoform X3 [Dromiciops gliroides]|uniref:ralBP1-associated Eps domain-containing protein 2 isoform X3 n=1 Tax=Dromiciops gliroides TaxID=33562 RepID=UPI001CC5A817|nr:ralBP1-associated Eps domain-containing protein 2 isoform X3 [Dromiciops gliroides]
MEPGPAAAVGTAGAVGAAANASAPAAAAAAAAGALSSGASVGYCPVPLPLSDSEQQCYSELFARCCCASATTSATTSSTSSSSSSSSGHTQPPPEVGRGAPLPGPTATAGANQVGDLFRASQLPAETLHQITELCGAKRVGYFGPTQFYVALKLIAAAQSGLPVRIESIKCELPLPRFMAMKNDSEIRYSNPAELHGVKCQIPYVTMEKNSFKRMDDAEKQQETMSPTMSPISSPPSSPSNYQRVPLTYGYGKLRSGMEQIHSAPYEARQLALQQEGPTSGSHGAKPPRLQTSLIRSLSVEREPQESNSNYPDDPWRITEEQREYYINQFKSLQPDLSSFISGSLAKNFFTKSKLTIPELSYIWELSDVDCDGALTLPEFCAAFHLIVARKNGYPLPESLPQTLQPDYVQTAFIKPKRDCALFDSYSESMTVNQQPRDLNRIETSIKEKADLTAGAQDVNTDDKQALKISSVDEAMPKDLSVDTAAKPGLLPPPPALPPRPFVSQALHHNTSSDSVSQPKPPGQLPGYGDFRLPEQTDQVPEIELHPQLTRTPSQPEESGSPVKKDLPHTQPPSKPIRRKFRPENQVMENQEPPSSVSGTSSAPAVKPHAPVQKQSSKQKKAIQTAIRKNKEANAVLARLNSELQQQLKEVHQERIALENQLEQLRPVTVL